MPAFPWCSCPPSHLRTGLLGRAPAHLAMEFGGKRSNPLLGIDIPHEASGDFTDAHRGARFENDRVAPALVFARRPCRERVGELGEGIPVR